MEEELEAAAFYISLGELAADGGLHELSDLAAHLADVEKNHYRILEANLASETTLKKLQADLRAHHTGH